MVLRLLGTFLQWIKIIIFRSQENFKIGGPEEQMPLAVIHAFGYLKKAAAICNQKFGLEKKLCDAIISAAGNFFNCQFLNFFLYFSTCLNL